MRIENIQPVERFFDTKASYVTLGFGYKREAPGVELDLPSQVSRSTRAVIDFMVIEAFGDGCLSSWDEAMIERVNRLRDAWSQMIDDGIQFRTRFSPNGNHEVMEAKETIGAPEEIGTMLEKLAIILQDQGIEPTIRTYAIKFGPGNSQKIQGIIQKITKEQGFDLNQYTSALYAGVAFREADAAWNFLFQSYEDQLRKSNYSAKYLRAPFLAAVLSSLVRTSGRSDLARICVERVIDAWPKEEGMTFQNRYQSTLGNGVENNRRGAQNNLHEIQKRLSYCTQADIAQLGDIVNNIMTVIDNNVTNVSDDDEFVNQMMALLSLIDRALLMC